MIFLDGDTLNLQRYRVVETNPQKNKGMSDPIFFFFFRDDPILKEFFFIFKFFLKDENLFGCGVLKICF